MKNAYLFIQQTRRTYEYYLRETRPIYEEKEDNGINEFEHLDETLIEIPGAKASGDEDSIQEEIKIECSVKRRDGCSADRLRSTDSFTNEDEDNFNTELEDKEECVFNIDDLEDSYDNRYVNKNIYSFTTNKNFLILRNFYMRGSHDFSVLILQCHVGLIIIQQ